MTTSLPPWWSEVEDHSTRVGVDPNIIRRIGGVESNFRNVPNASGPGGRPASSATGVFQFTEGTFRDVATRYPDLALTDRRDPAQQARAMVYFTRDNIEDFRRRTGRDPSPSEVYLSHFLGRAGVARLEGVSDDTPVTQAVDRDAVLSNASVFSRNPTVGALRQWAAAKMEGGEAPVAQRPLVSFGEQQPNNPLTNREQRDIQRAQDEQDPGLVRGLALAARQEWSMLWALQGNSDMAPDPDFRMTPERLRELTQDVPERYWGFFEQAHSDAHAGRLREAMMRDLEVERQLGAMGWTGTGLRVLTAIVDPLAIGIGLASGAAATPALAAFKAGRLARIATAGGTAAAGNALTEAIIVSNKPTGEALDIVVAAGAGLVLGSAFGAMSRNPAVAREAAALEQVGRSLQARAEADAAGEAVLRGNAGAAEASYREALRVDTFDFVRDAPDVAERTAAGRVRFDVSAATKNSQNPLTSVLGGNLVEDPVGNLNREVATNIGASERQALIQRRMETLWRQDAETAYKEYAERQGWNWWQRQSRRGEFNESITDYVRNRDPSIEFDPAVKRVGDAFRNLMDRFRQLANDPGAEMGMNLRPVRGFGGLEKNPNYVPRIHDIRKVDELVSTFGDKNLRALLSQAIRAVQTTLTEEVADKIAKGYLKRVRQLRLGDEVNGSRMLTGEDPDLLRLMLKDETDLDDAAIDRIVGEFRPERSDGAVERGKRRQLMDENFGLTLTSTDGTATRFVRIRDMLNNDADMLFQMYNRSMSGIVALAQVRVKNPNWKPGDTAPEFLVDGITNQAEFDKLIRQVQSVGDEIGQRPDQIAKDVANLRFMYNAIAGIPDPADLTNAGQALRMLRDYNFTRVMGQVGFAQIAELGNITGQLGIRAMIEGVPSFRSLWRNAKTGQLDDELAREIEWMTTAGTDWLRGSVATKWDDFGSPLTYVGNSAALNTADNALQRGKRITSAVSGMAPINTLLQRWTAKAILAKFADIAAKPTRANMDRMRTLGLSDDMLTRVLGEFKTHGDFLKSEVSGRNLRRINFDKWQDLEARSAFEHAVFRWSRRIIQENDVGAMHRWMSNPLAKTLLQFRTFMAGAWSKQFLHNVHMRDMETFMAFSASMFSAGLTYTVQTYMQSLGRSDQEAFLERRLSAEAIGLASFQRAGFASLFPLLIDSGARGVGLDPLFDFRTTGQPTDALFGNPTVGLIDDAAKATAGAVDIFRGGFSQADARNMLRVLPFQNVLPVTMGFNALIHQLPERDPRR